MKKFFLISAVLLLLSSCIDIDGSESEYLSFVLAIISNSSLDNETKRMLAESFVVGNASRKLWDTSTTEE
jgi:hypothetical protein